MYTDSAGDVGCLGNVLGFVFATVAHLMPHVHGKFSCSVLTHYFINRFMAHADPFSSESSRYLLRRPLLLDDELCDAPYQSGRDAAIPRTCAPSTFSLQLGFLMDIGSRGQRVTFKLSTHR